MDRFNSSFKLTGDIFVRVSEWVWSFVLYLCLILLFSSLFLFFSFHLIVTDRCCFNYRWPKSNSKSKIQNQCGLSQNFKSLFFNFQSRDHEACYVIPRFCVALLTLLTLLIVNNTHTHTHKHTPIIVLKFLYIYFYLFIYFFNFFAVFPNWYFPFDWVVFNRIFWCVPGTMLMLGGRFKLSHGRGNETEKQQQQQQQQIRKQ